MMYVTSKSWDNAHLDCKARGGYLATYYTQKVRKACGFARTHLEHGGATLCGDGLAASSCCTICPAAAGHS